MQNGYSLLCHAVTYMAAPDNLHHKVMANRQQMQRQALRQERCLPPMVCALREHYDLLPYYIIRPCLEHNLGVESTRRTHSVRETLPGRECADCLVNHLPGLHQQEVAR